MNLKIHHLLPVITCAHVLDDVFRAADWLSTKARGTCFDICQNMDWLKFLKTTQIQRIILYFQWVKVWAYYK